MVNRVNYIYSKYSADKSFYDLTELVVANNRLFRLFSKGFEIPKDSRDEEPVISGERELNNLKN